MIAIACDHGGYDLKLEIIKYLKDDVRAGRQWIILSMQEK